MQTRDIYIVWTVLTYAIISSKKLKYAHLFENILIILSKNPSRRLWIEQRLLLFNPTPQWKKSIYPHKNGSCLHRQTKNDAT